MRIRKATPEDKWKRLEALAEALSKASGKDVLVSCYDSIEDVGGFFGAHVYCHSDPDEKIE